MPAITPYLSFDGNCAEAMRFYEGVLNGKIEALLTHDQTPAKDQVPPGNGDRIMHARLVFDGGDLMAGDSLVGQPHGAMKGVALTLTYPTAAAAKSIFDALGDGGKTTMPFSETFWADGFGMVTDRFGTHWIVNGGMKPFGGGGNA